MPGRHHPGGKSSSAGCQILLRHLQLYDNLLAMMTKVQRFLLTGAVFFFVVSLVSLLVSLRLGAQQPSGPPLAARSATTMPAPLTIQEERDLLKLRQKISRLEILALRLQDEFKKVAAQANEVSAEQQKLEAKIIADRKADGWVLGAELEWVKAPQALSK